MPAGLGFLAEACALEMPSFTTPLATTTSTSPPLSCPVITLGTFLGFNSLVSDKLAKVGSHIWHNHTDPCES